MPSLHDQATPGSERSLLRTRRGFLTLLLLCGIQFMDAVDTSIVNVALPSIKHSLHVSQQSLQWVISGYLLTYGGFLLLGGRAADLLGRRRVLIFGLILFAFSSLAGGLANSQGLLIGARIVQGIGAAIMAPAGLSILTTTFREGKDRNTALGVWGGVSAIGAAMGVALGGLLSEGPGWRWVFFVNLPVVVLALGGAFWLLPGERRRARFANFDSQGALLVTSGMLLLVFAVNELRSVNPLFPFSILRVKGLAAADATQLIAFAGFLSMFFFVTLYMQEVLHLSPIQAGVASQLVARIGTRPVIVAGALIAAAGIFWLSRVPAHGTYAADVLPGLLIMPLGAGAVFVAVATAANAGVSADKAGLAAGLLNAAGTLGS